MELIWNGEYTQLVRVSAGREYGDIGLERWNVVVVVRVRRPGTSRIWRLDSGQVVPGSK